MKPRHLLIGLVVLVLLFVSLSVGLTNQFNSAKNPVPDVVKSSVKYAKEVWLKDFSGITVQDAAGRGRKIGGWRSGDEADWVVCSQNPRAGKQWPKNGGITLYAVPLTESCPRQNNAEEDSEVGKAVQARYPLPSQWGRTPLQVRTFMGDDATLQFFDYKTGRKVDDGSGNHRVCTQQLAEGHDFYGQPVAFTVVSMTTLFGDAINLKDECPADTEWLGVPGQRTDLYPPM